MKHFLYLLLSFTAALVFQFDLLNFFNSNDPAQIIVGVLIAIFAFSALAWSISKANQLAHKQHWKKESRIFLLTIHILLALMGPLVLMIYIFLSSPWGFT